MVDSLNVVANYNIGALIPAPIRYLRAPCSSPETSFIPVVTVSQRASRFCADNSLHGSEEALLTQMEDATTRSKACVSVVERHTEERPETEEGTDLEKDEKLHAIINLQRARARVMQESTASFEQVPHVHNRPWSIPPTKLHIFAYDARLLRKFGVRLMGHPRCRRFVASPAFGTILGCLSRMEPSTTTAPT